MCPAGDCFSWILYDLISAPCKAQFSKLKYSEGSDLNSQHVSYHAVPAVEHQVCFSTRCSERMVCTHVYSTKWLMAQKKFDGKTLQIDSTIARLRQEPWWCPDFCICLTRIWTPRWLPFTADGTPVTERPADKDFTESQHKAVYSEFDLRFSSIKAVDWHDDTKLHTAAVVTHRDQENIIFNLILEKYTSWIYSVFHTRRK